MKLINEHLSEIKIKEIFKEVVVNDQNLFGELSPKNGCVRYQFLNIMIFVFTT